MNFLTDWITQIVFFIFLATIISLLIPTTSHQKVIKLVFGLVIFLLFLHPLTELFGINPDQIVQSWQVSLEGLTEEDLEEQINNKKNEIQASQDAYILEQLQQDIKSLLEEDLMNQYQVAIRDISISLNDEAAEGSTEEVVQNFESITFRLEKQSDNRINEVEDVTIPTKPEPNTHDEEDAIKQTIASKLNVSAEQIKLVWGGA
ncbi:stage III sporulation protein AF [Tenuibacillus multivorans]|uniref:Stage III sporulation protein AF n=1 Tax=Tenuibacillus multivorans TaxID=237069 RepID=A0A1G9Z9L3_9BACI|nr:stage III sporulation protein AF [Tenuibacillus multivorans]SDN17326.1 stage III sporulation protein AF [Tenuibacillus multivorans]